VTAGDFEYAWRRVLDPTTRSELADLLYDLRGARARHHGTPADPGPLGVRALDDVTLEVELEAPTSYFLHLLTVCTARPVPRHVLQAYGGVWADPGRIVTSGPFRLGGWDRGRLLTLERSSTYRGRSGGNAQQAQLMICGDRDEGAWLRAYDRDRLDIVDFSLISAANWDQVRNRYPEDYVTSPAQITQYIAFDVTRPPFNDRRVRRAVAFAVDRDALAGTALRGYGSPATGGFVPPGMPGYSSGIGLSYDPQRGRKLLAEAGYASGLGFPTLEPMRVLGDELADVLEHLRAQLIDNLGIEVSWLDVSRAEAFDPVGSGQPHMYVTAWQADFPDPASFLWDGGWWSGSGWRHEAYAEHLETARHTTNQEERIALYQAADRILIEECPIIPLCYLRRSMLVKPWVSWSRPAGASGWRSWGDLIIEPH
jgi:oligopeptide transport system substrate-binding protein